MSDKRQSVVLAAVVVLVVAFVASFFFGLGRSEKPAEEVIDADKPQPLVVGDARARVEVLNGAGKSGLARVATAQLRDAGYDVVGFGNAPLTSASSVTDRVGKIEAARGIAQTLSIATVSTVIDSTRYVDATVLLGSDWPPRQAPAAEKKSWLDKLLRR